MRNLLPYLAAAGLYVAWSIFWLGLTPADLAWWGGVAVVTIVFVAGAEVGERDR